MSNLIICEVNPEDARDLDIFQYLEKCMDLFRIRFALTPEEERQKVFAYYGVEETEP